MDEVEHDIENYQLRRGLRYLPKPEAETDNTSRGLDNCRYHAKTEFNNCFIMYSKPKNKELCKGKTRKSHAKLIRTTFFFMFALNAAMFLKQINDSNQSFKLTKIDISSTTCRFVL